MRARQAIVVLAMVVGIGALSVEASEKKEAAKAAHADAPAVKKSDSGFCHGKSSPSYERTENFTPVRSIDACMKSGGKTPQK